MAIRLYKIPDRHFITLHAQAAYHPFASAGEVAVVAERFSCMNIGDMYFHGRRCHGRQGICNCDGCMRITAGIDDDPVKGKPNLMYFVDQRAFMVRLEILKFCIRNRFLSSTK
jgi:hypothetical protein